jgi:hypothetical protein
MSLLIDPPAGLLLLAVMIGVLSEPACGVL